MHTIEVRIVFDCFHSQMSNKLNIESYVLICCCCCCCIVVLRPR